MSFLSSEYRPVAIGGIGGSGTRVFAKYISELGYYIGSDLNGALDNLWFTYLFKRRSVLLDTHVDFDDLTALYFSRMKGPIQIGPDMLEYLHNLASKPRLLHSADWLQSRLETFTEPALHTADGLGGQWGWKEPNTHVVIDRLLRRHDDLVYIHVMRNALDMAHSANQSQLALWGPVFLDRDVTVGPRDSLAYWGSVHRRMLRLQEEFSERVLLVKYEDMIGAPEKTCRQIAAFLGVTDWSAALDTLGVDLQPPSSVGRYKQFGTELFAARDLAFAASLGYAAE